MNNKIDVSVHSEIGKLETVIVHKPGPEVENMTPLNAERALYSDILNLSVARKEYSQLASILARYSRVLHVDDLLEEVLNENSVRDKLVRSVCQNECTQSIIEYLLGLEPKVLAQQLIEGVPIIRDSLTNYLSKSNYALRPLHNFFFTRDSSVSIYDRVLISKMASRVRERESLIMQTIFDHHPGFDTTTMNPSTLPLNDEKITMEGGDILIAREDIILMGTGARSTPQGVDFILNRLKDNKKPQHIIVQELPYEPESFIHLDMVFTFLDEHSCMIYGPLILKANKYETVQITIDNGSVTSIKSVKNIPSALKKLGMPLDIMYCGGRKDSITQEREQWHSGANFLALAPGKVLGYSRNVYTLEELNQNGYEIVRANDVISEKKDPGEYKKYVIAFDGTELSRGGGGARCMTMPLKRKAL